jgi:hypothetical protein
MWAGIKDKLSDAWNFVTSLPGEVAQAVVDIATNIQPGGCGWDGCAGYGKAIGPAVDGINDLGEVHDVWPKAQKATSKVLPLGHAAGRRNHEFMIDNEHSMNASEDLDNYGPSDPNPSPISGPGGHAGCPKK